MTVEVQIPGILIQLIWKLLESWMLILFSWGLKELSKSSA